MKVTFFIGCVSGGGAEHVVCELASYLSNHGFESEILTVTNGEKSYDIDPKVKLSTLDSGKRSANSKIRLISKMLSLLRFVVKNKTDVYIVFLPKTIRAFMYFRKLVKAPIIVSERNSPLLYSEKERKQMIRCFSRASGIVCQTENIKDFYRKHIPQSESCVVIPNAIAGMIPENSFVEREKVISAVGRLDPQKNYPLLLSAFKDVSVKYPEYKLKIYGKGPLLDECRKLTQKLGIADKVIFEGFVKNVAAEIKNSAIYILSSDYEGMPNALIEAMAAGLPCIATDCNGGGPGFLIQNGKNGILIPMNDKQKMADAMISLIENPDYAEKLGKEARKIREVLSPEKIYKKWTDFIMDVINNKNNRMQKNSR